MIQYLRKKSRLKHDRWLEQFGLWRTPGAAFEHTLDWAKNLSDDPYLAKYAQLLQEHAPVYYAELYHGLMSVVRGLKPMAEKVSDLEITVRVAHEQMAEMKVVAREARANTVRYRMSAPFTLIARVPGYFSARKLLVTLISMGLSLMVVLGMTDMWGVELADPFEEIWLRLLGLIFSAVSVNLATQYILKNQVNIMLKRRYAASDVEPLPSPFWQEFIRGNAVLWTALLMVILEVLFSYVFLLQQLPLLVRSEFLAQFAVFCGSGYFAFLNVSLAYTEGLIEYFDADKTNPTNDNAYTLQDYEAQFYDAELKVAKAKATLHTIERRHKHLEREYQKHRKEVVKYSQNWFRAMPYLIDDMEEKGAPSPVIAEIEKVLSNGHGQASEVRIQ
jgi:hypothetical protein